MFPGHSVNDEEMYGRKDCRISKVVPRSNSPLKASALKGFSFCPDVGAVKIKPAHAKEYGAEAYCRCRQQSKGKEQADEERIGKNIRSERDRRKAVSEMGDKRLFPCKSG